MILSDYKKALTAEDLIRRYNLDNIKKDRKVIQQLEKSLNGTNAIIEDYVKAVTKDIEGLQNQVDGNIATWFFNGVPTLENKPANEWTTDNDKNTHLGDLYYDQETGYAYRFSLQDNTYSWTKIADSDVAKALAIANSAQDTADNKRRVFVVTPIPPYDVGDIWIKEDKVLYRCRATRKEGNFNEVDWKLATDYTNDDYAKNVEAVLNQFKEYVTTNYVTHVQLETTSDSIIGVVESKTTKIETKVVDLENSIDIYSADLDIYNLTIPVSSDKKPLETKDYLINFNTYYKGQQVTSTVNTSSILNGINTTFTSSQIKLSVNSETVIPSLNNEIIINFIYKNGEEINTISKKVVVTLSLKGDTGIQGPAGKDGVSTYFYVKYSENANGNPMTQTPTNTTKYMGVASTTSTTAPTDYDAYIWTLIKGTDGTNGSPGTNGIDGKTSYLHIKYSDDGVVFTPADENYAEGERPSAYIGQLVDFVQADSTNFNDYTWYKFTEDIDDTLNDLQNQVSSNTTDIHNNYQDINNKLGNYATVETVTEVTKRVEQLQNDSEWSVKAIEDIKVNGVTQVRTEAGMSFDKEGLHLDKTGAKTGSILDESGLEVIDKTSSSETTQLFTGYVTQEMAQKNPFLINYVGQTVTYTSNLIVGNYFQMGNSRWESVHDDVHGNGIGCFIAGGSK